MKTLTLLRHAKSGWNDPLASDFDRPLNPRGRRAARIIGQEMRSRESPFDRIVASPALRVIETLGEVSSGYGKNLAPTYDQRLYLASPSTLLEVIHETDDEVGNLLIVGHNPGLEALALFLTPGGGDDALRDELALKYPTAALARISLPVNRWSGITEGMGKLDRFVRPRDLDPELGPGEVSRA